MTNDRGFIEPASAQARVAAAVAALESTREQIVTAVSPKKAKARTASGPAAGSPPAPAAEGRATRPSSPTFGPIASAIGAVLRGWWQHHPLRKTVEDVESTGNALIGPHVRRHPALALAGAASVGAALVLVFPRRGWALALPWIGMEARSIVRGFWRSWYARRTPSHVTPH